jgi:hypothetical protein
MNFGPIPEIPFDSFMVLQTIDESKEISGIGLIIVML